MDSVVAPEQRACEGFVLRSYREGDGERLAEAVNESYEHLRPWMPWARPHQTAEASERLVRQFRARYLLAENGRGTVLSNSVTQANLLSY